MGELSKRMMVSGGNISGIATQLEAEGFITRSPVPGNRRTFCVCLTEVGERQFSKIAAQHEQWVIEMLGHLSGGEVDQLMESLKKVKAGLANNGGR